MKQEFIDIELYIHIPFCIRKCNYCDFLSFVAEDEMKERYIKALLKEIEGKGRELKEKGCSYQVATIFIGGGTPSILTEDQISRIMETVYRSFSIREDAEISMECNPGTLNRDKLLSYKRAGVNRISMGLQTTDPGCLECLGRIHSLDQFLENYQLAREVGFDNINVDLMSALPGQTLASYKEGLALVTDLKPEHISAYSLIIEEGTPFYDSDEILDALPDEEEERAMYELTGRFLKEKGYHRYEISNYAREGRECRHNLGYWSDVAYYGLGLGASSYTEDKIRYRNEEDLQAYIEAMEQGGQEIRRDVHALSLEEQMEEYMFLGLRKANGISCDHFYDRFGVSVREIYGSVIEKYVGMGLLVEEAGRLFLSEAGLDVCNPVFADFLLSV